MFILSKLKNVFRSSLTIRANPQKSHSHKSFVDGREKQSNLAEHCALEVNTLQQHCADCPLQKVTGCSFLKRLSEAFRRGSD